MKKKLKFPKFIIFILIIIVMIAAFLINEDRKWDTDKYVNAFLKALYTGDNDVITKHSDLDPADILWRDKVTKKYLMYKDGGINYMEYWIEFENGFQIYMDIFVDMHERRKDGTEKYWDWKIRSVCKTNRPRDNFKDVWYSFE